ncbi:flagellar hook-associated protein FlgK [Desulfobacula toluolica]|uniref:Flagellar hook-associated protein 1 n=1 Tax=Desulfobacula toluolica (strain DSM 7467 / Tol2) TaxID=651182 RepID=K0NBK0_DESTT|nr:flagellar hook-associated protein FlgK [Desulfobacula toluolica]CCK81709.1 FlgK: putative flagellar hook-associated protein 1 [Desulfobacula toluolica Tol2]
MSGITSTLSIAKSAIAAQQYGLAVTGNNIANVNNPGYSMQNAVQLNRRPSLYAGFLFGTGVDTSQIQQNVDTLLENRLTDERSSQAAFEETESYMNILEGFFDENSDASITSIMNEFWNSWHDLSDNPLGSSERVSVYEKGSNFSTRLNKAGADLEGIGSDMNNEIDASLDQINSLSSQVADLNIQIAGLEANRSANDLRDQRNTLLNKLGTLINIDTFEQTNGSTIVNVANGLILVNGADNYELFRNEDRIMWQGSSRSNMDITDKISGGKLAGWLEIRDEIVPKFSNELDVLAREMIWAMNYQHSQGSGMEYFTGSVTGNYESDQSGLLSSYAFGDKIDYTKDFTLWTQDNSSVDTLYTKTEIDMGISEAKISNWQGTGQVQSSYKLTVMESATLGDKEVVQTDGSDLAAVQTSGIDVADALNSALAEQTITVNNGPSGTQIIEIKDTGGDAQRSAASIAEALSAIDGVDAYASKVSAEFDVSGITTAQDGDEVRFSLYVDGIVYDQRFTVDTDGGTIPLADAVAEQFENALRDAANSINDIRDDHDLFTSGLKITSSAGHTIGVQDFEVQDNTGVRLENFTGFDAGNTVTFTVASSTTTPVSIDLSSVDTNDQAVMATAFYNALTSALKDEPFTVAHDPSSNSVILRTTDGSGLTIKDGDNTVGANLDIIGLSGTNPALNNFLLDGSLDSDTFVSVASNGDTIDFTGQGTPDPPVPIEEISAAGVAAGVITGTVTVVMDPGMSLYSNVSGAGGLFDGNWAESGSSIMTLGGEDGFPGFSDVISFKVDGIDVSYDVATAGHTTELEFAQGLADALDGSVGGALPVADYKVVRNGKSVSIIKNKDLSDPIEITNFAESVSNDAKLAVRTGTGTGTSDPQNDFLQSGNIYRDFATASLFADEGIIKWEKYDADGIFTGDEGLINVEKEGTLSIVESGSPTLSFDISAGNLVAGNTLTVNTDAAGNTDPLDFTVSGAANNKNEIYKFTVTTGGKMGELAADEADTITVEWKTGTSSGMFELEGSDPVLTPGIPIEVEVDGMTLKFYDGTLFKNDAFTITTDASGIPVSTNDKGIATGELLSDWHWTLDSFAGQFNRQAGGMKASTTLDNQLKFEVSDDYHALTDVVCSGSNGFSEDNARITVSDWSAFNFSADDFKVVRSSTGEWSIVNDPTGGTASFIPDGGDDDGFGIDFSGNGLVDIEIAFTQKVSDQGFIQFDLAKRETENIGFAFSDDSVGASSGLLAAAGINTFFNGYDAGTMDMNKSLADTKYVAAARINSETGEIAQGDNTNALAMADVQYMDITMKQWDYDRGAGAVSSLTTTTLDGYYSTMTGSMGIIARRIQSSREFAEIMVNNLTEQRDSVSAVSLDEEMIKLMQYQHGFSAASKLLTVADEMLTTLINVI